MFRLVVFIHLLAAAALTIYLTFYWQRASSNILERERRRICRIFSGCVAGPGTNATADELQATCNTYAVKLCTGDRRCCLDCRAAKPLNAPNQRDTVVLDFADEHGSAVTIVAIGVSSYAFVYVVVVITRIVETNITSTVNKKERRRYYKRRCCKAVVGVLLICGFLMLIVTTIYSVSYVARAWYTLKDCQTTLFYLVSWSIFFILASVDYTISFFPMLVHALTTTGSNNLSLLSTVITKCLSRLVNGIGGILLLWWLFVAIYLEGVYRGRWLLTL